MYYKLEKMINKLKNFNLIQQDSKKLIRYIVLFICCIVVIVQISECLLKLRRPPIATHSHYDLNDTLSMPAITFCREPPYKPNVLKQYELNDHPKYTIHWRRFPFNDTTNLIKVFEESTYNFNESFVQYALNKDQSFIEVTSSLHFNYGQCHTIRPVQPSKNYFKENGYSLMLQHSLPKSEQPLSIQPSGWHIFIHETKENFTEIKMKASGRIEYIFAEVEEEIEIKLQTKQFAMIKKPNVCTDDPDYSASKCAEMYIWNTLTKKINCSGPWMIDIDIPYCKNYSSMKNLIDDYMNIYDGEVELNSGCLEPCTSIIYSIFVQNRKKFKQPSPRTQLWIYYTSKLVSIIEEHPGYDLSQFVSDMGGTLGFLLGLSVLGLIGIIEKISIILISNLWKRIDDKKSKNLTTGNDERNNLKIVISNSYDNHNKNEYKI